jgi:hypothetical protein
MLDQVSDQQLEELKAEHRELDQRIAELSAESSSLGQIELARLKKRKLLLKDRIQLIMDQSTPDIIA